MPITKFLCIRNYLKLKRDNLNIQILLLKKCFTCEWIFFSLPTIFFCLTSYIVIAYLANSVFCCNAVAAAFLFSSSNLWSSSSSEVVVRSCCCCRRRNWLQFAYIWTELDCVTRCDGTKKLVSRIHWEHLMLLKLF